MTMHGTVRPQERRSRLSAASRPSHPDRGVGDAPPILRLSPGARASAARFFPIRPTAKPPQLGPACDPSHLKLVADRLEKMPCVICWLWFRSWACGSRCRLPRAPRRRTGRRICAPTSLLSLLARAKPPRASPCPAGATETPSAGLITPVRNGQTGERCRAYAFSNTNVCAERNQR